MSENKIDIITVQLWLFLNYSMQCILQKRIPYIDTPETICDSANKFNLRIYQKRYTKIYGTPVFEYTKHEQPIFYHIILEYGRNYMRIEYLYANPKNHIAIHQF